MYSEKLVFSVVNKIVFCIIRFEQVDERFVPIGPAQTHWQRRHLSKSRCTWRRSAGHAVRQAMELREAEAKTARSARHIQVILDANCCAQRRFRGCGHYIQVNAVAFLAGKHTKPLFSIWEICKNSASAWIASFNKQFWMRHSFAERCSHITWAA